MNNINEIQEDKIPSIQQLPRYIQDLIPIIAENIEKYRDPWPSEQLTEEARVALTNSDLARKKYKQELIKL